MKRIARIVFIKIPVAFFAITFILVLALRWVPVYVTPLMLCRSIEYKNDPGFSTQKKWTSYRNISPELAKAVIAGEDNRFPDHNGFDWQEMQKAINDHRNKGKRLRGASTISQQTAKNVFLFPSHSFIRKAFEAYFTVLIELLWGKERIMEVYLNVAEMGKGIYGAEAAAVQLFSKNAAELTSRDASLIAACLPNPLQRKADRPSAYVSKRARQIRMLTNKLEYPEWISRN